MLGAVLFDLAPVLFDRISPIRLQGGAGTDQSEYRLANCSPESNTGVPEAKFGQICLAPYVHTQYRPRDEALRLP